MRKIMITVGAWLRHRKSKVKQPKDSIKEDHLFWYTDWRPELVGKLGEVTDKNEEYIWVKIGDSIFKLEHDQYELEEAKEVRTTTSKVL